MGLSSSRSGTGSGVKWLRVALLVLSGLWIFYPCLHGTWAWDDVIYLPQNPLLNDPDRLWKIWFAPGSMLDYYPVEATLQYGQWQLWGNATFGYHLTNVLLHIISGLLVWWLLDKLGLRLAWLGGLLFIIHPMQVESVAYIAEFKNTLSLPFFLLAMGCWIDYEKDRRARDYWLALGLFLLAMLCKITMAPFPAVILLYAWWRRVRIGLRDFEACLPFLFISIALGATTLLSGIWHRELHLLPDEVVPLGGFFSRMACVGLTLSFYFSEAILPLSPLPFYPLWPLDPPSLMQFLPWPVFVGVACFLWRKRNGWGRHALLGLGFFVLMLSPFLGFTPVSYMSYSWVMDHFLYIPIIGLIGLAVAALGQIEDMLSPLLCSVAVGLFAVIAALLALESHLYAAKFISEETLWVYAIKHNPGALAAHNNLGLVYQIQGRLAEAEREYREVLELNPNYESAHNNLGSVLMSTGRLPEAIAQFYASIALDPNYASVHYNLADALSQVGRSQEAIEEYQRALQLKPKFAEADYSFANLLIQLHQIPAAIHYYQEAVQIRPDYTDAHANLGNALLQTGHTPEAIDQYLIAIKLSPNDPDLHTDLGIAIAQTGRLDEAKAQLNEALRLDPHYEAARKYLLKIEAYEKKNQAK